MSTRTADENREAIVRDLSNKLREMPDERFESVTDPAEISERMAHLVPAASAAFGNLIGPVYSTRALMSMWGITRAAVSKKVKEGRLLALKVENENLFPVFQFDGQLVREEIMELVRILRASADSFTIAQWLSTPQADDAQHRTPLTMLDHGHRKEVEAAARSAAARWAA